MENNVKKNRNALHVTVSDDTATIINYLCERQCNTAGRVIDYIVSQALQAGIIPECRIEAIEQYIELKQAALLLNSNTMRSDRGSGIASVEDIL